MCAVCAYVKFEKIIFKRDTFQLYQPEVCSIPVVGWLASFEGITQHREGKGTKKKLFILYLTGLRNLDSL